MCPWYYSGDALALGKAEKAKFNLARNLEFYRFDKVVFSWIMYL